MLTVVADSLPAGSVQRERSLHQRSVSQPRQLQGGVHVSSQKTDRIIDQNRRLPKNTTLHGESAFTIELSLAARNHQELLQQERPDHPSRRGRRFISKSNENPVISPEGLR